MGRKKGVPLISTITKDAEFLASLEIGTPLKSKTGAAGRLVVRSIDRKKGIVGTLSTKGRFLKKPVGRLRKNYEIEGGK